MLTNGHGERPSRLPGKRRSETTEISISPKRIKPTIDPSSIKFEQPKMMLHEDAVLSTSRVKLWAAGLPTTYPAYHAYEDGALAFSTDYGDFFMLCDGVSGCESSYTPQFVNALLGQLKVEIEEFLGDSFDEDKTSFDNHREFYNRVLDIFSYSLNSQPVQSIKKEIDINNLSEMELNYPSTTLSILFLDHSNQLFYFVCGDSGFQVKNLNGELIHDLSGETATPLFDINQFLDHPEPFDIMDLRPSPAQLNPMSDIREEPTLWGRFQLSVGDSIHLASDGVWDNFNNVPKDDLFLAPRECDLMGEFTKFWDKQLSKWEEKIQDEPPEIKQRFNQQRDRLLSKIQTMPKYPVKSDDTTLLSIEVTEKQYSASSSLNTFPHDFSDSESDGTTVESRSPSLENLLKIEKYGCFGLSDLFCDE